MNLIPANDTGLPRVYVEQPLTIQLDTKTNITNAHSRQIRLHKVENRSYIGAPTFIETTLNGTIISGNIPGGFLTVGIWELRSWIIFSVADHFPTPGDPVFITVLATS